jgi:uncharacterized protein
MFVASNDRVTVADLALAAYERALEPKRLRLIPGGHFDPYLDEFPHAEAAATGWFREHLINPVASRSWVGTASQGFRRDRPSLLSFLNQNRA